jgi:hypothetical protein
MPPPTSTPSTRSSADRETGSGTGRKVPDEGAAVFVQYRGRVDLSRGFQFPLTANVAPRFETGDERYT